MYTIDICTPVSHLCYQSLVTRHMRHHRWDVECSMAYEGVVPMLTSPRSSLITSWPCISSGSSTLSGDVTRVYAHFTGGKKEPNQKTTAAAATVMHSLVDRASGVSTYSCTACYMSYTRNVSMYNNIYMYLVS